MSDAKRDRAFFNSDVAGITQNLAFVLGGDYGLSEEQAYALAEQVEELVHEFFHRAQVHA